MKKYICIICAVCATLTSCSDFFSPETDDEFDAAAGYSSNTEMYTGFLGVITKMQAVGDKEILLTETRGELIEPTDDSTSDLISIHNYAPNLQENPYANPAGYYELIIACNDYLNSMVNYRDFPNVDDDAWQALVSSTVRIKVWAYKTLAEIYGQAVWFDDPMIEVTDIHDSRFELLQLPELIDRCLKLLEQGFHGVKPNLAINWIAWLDPENVNNVVDSKYRKWNYMVPDHSGLFADLCLWKGAVMDSQGLDAVSYYQDAADTLLLAINGVVAEHVSNNYWLPSGSTQGRYSAFWTGYGDEYEPYPMEVASAIIYDYEKNQTNTLLKHFSKEFPYQYWLRPSQAAMDRFRDEQYNPGWNTDSKTMTRFNKCFRGTDTERPWFGKFYSDGHKMDDEFIYIYRAMHYHLMLCEALNHLQRFIAMDAVLNGGVKSAGDNCFEAGKPEWKGFESIYDPTVCDWTNDTYLGSSTRQYGSEGIRGCFGLQPRPVKTSTYELGRELTLRFNDEALLEEAMMELAGEGKVYPMMNRMAVRYNDPSIVADRVCIKYTDPGLAATVRSRIMDGAYWVPFDLYNE